MSLLHHISILPSLVFIQAGGDIHFICHVTPQYHPFKALCIFMGQSCFQEIAALESLVARTLELTFIQVMSSQMKINILIHQVL